jgi:hypothetical protein
MRFVWLTSKIEDFTEPLLDQAMVDNPHKSISILWHQDVFMVAWAFRRLHATTIAGRGDMGDVIARMLKKCNYTTFRGGSSMAKNRQKKILTEFIEHLEKQDKFSVGITVDGSSGPIFRMKTGVIVMAMKTGAPLYIVRSWAKRRILLSNWDRTMIPLPFNRIVIACEGPFYPPENMDQESVFNQFHLEMEKKLLDTTYETFIKVDGQADSKLVNRFPKHWKKPAPVPIGNILLK